MIRNKTDYYLYRRADKIIAGKDNCTFSQQLKAILFSSKIDRFLYLLRTCEYYKNCSKSIIDKVIFYYYYYRFKKISLQLGFSIPLNVFGPGLLIPHYGTIVVNPNTSVGKCCVLHTCVCVAGGDQKKIGDFAYFSKGVTLSGGLRIADNVTISANSLVNKDCLSRDVLIGGIPAKVLKNRAPWYINDGEHYKIRVDKIERLFEKQIGLL